MTWTTSSQHIWKRLFNGRQMLERCRVTQAGALAKANSLERTCAAINYRDTELEGRADIESASY